MRCKPNTTTYVISVIKLRVTDSVLAEGKCTLTKMPMSPLVRRLGPCVQAPRCEF